MTMTTTTTAKTILAIVICTWLGAGAAAQTPLVDTGQTGCYSDLREISCPQSGEPFFGQDAQHSGNQPAYQDNGDGTVTDLNTGLMWQQGFAEDKLTYAEAQGYVDSVNAQRIAGYNDWRLPTIKQLYSLIDFRGTDPFSNSTIGLVPFIETDYFEFAYGETGAGERVIDSQWVTTTLYTADSSMMFGVNFADGRIKGYGTGAMGPQGAKTFYVRLCRGSTDYGSNSFVNNSDGTVTDQATGLMWTRSDSAQGMTWEDALAWAAQKNAESFLGYTDWRVPNAKDLHSILDYTRSPDTTGSAAIDPIFNASTISNEYGETDYPFYWTSTTFLRSNGSVDAAVYIAFGRGLGYMNGQFVDIHGAGCQRSDPKDGDANDYPSWGNGPQGDVQRVFNHVRLVRDAGDTAPADPTYSYWIEIAANLAGQGSSRWRTDLAVRNGSAASAEISLVLHGEDGEHSLSTTISGSHQAAFEDVVGLLGVTGKGALEIRSDQPLAAVARIYNQDSQGTFGQFLAAATTDEGLSAGEGGWLLGLRQLSGSFRTNLTVTNTGAETATVRVELYTSDSTRLHTYTISVAPSQVVQDLEPFSSRAGRTSLGWGFARVTVVAGSGILSSASVIDSRTGDAITVAMSR
jgi:hypothetical protein